MKLFSTHFLREMGKRLCLLDFIILDLLTVSSTRNLSSIETILQSRITNCSIVIQLVLNPRWYIKNNISQGFPGIKVLQL